MKEYLPNNISNIIKCEHSYEFISKITENSSTDLTQWSDQKISNHQSVSIETELHKDILEHINKECNFEWQSKQDISK